MKRRSLAGLLVASMVALAASPVLVGVAEAATKNTSTAPVINASPVNQAGLATWGGTGTVITMAAEQVGSAVEVTVSGPNGPYTSAFAGYTGNDHQLQAYIRVDGAANTRGAMFAAPVSPLAVAVSSPTYAGGFSIKATFPGLPVGSHTFTLTDFLLNGNGAASGGDFGTPAGFDAFYNPGTTTAQVVAGVDWPLAETVDVTGGGQAPDPTTTTLTSSKASSAFGEPVTLTATIVGGSAPRTGTVSFKRAGQEIGTGSVTTGSTATFATAALPPGDSSLTAVYSGDATHEPSTSAAITQTVGKASPSLALASTPNPSTVGSPVVLTATLAGGFSPSGTVTFKDGTTTLGTGPVTSGVATLTATALALGARSLTAEYAGDANNSAATSAALTQQVNASSGTAVDLAAGALTAAYTCTTTINGAPIPADWTGSVSVSSTSTAVTVNVGLGPKTGPLVIAAGTLEPSVTYKVGGAQATGVGPKYGSINTFTQVPPFSVTGTVSALPTTVEILNVKYDDQGVDNADTACVPKAPATVPLTNVSLPSEPPANPDGAITVQGTPTAGGSLTLTGSGFKPSATVATALYSTPQVLGVGQADASGTFSATVTIPAGTTGPHTLLMSGDAPTGTSPRILTAAITVAAPPAGGSPGGGSTGDGTSAGTLPETGPGDSIPALIVGLIALQVGLVVAVRSHRALAPAIRGGGRHRLGV